METSYELEVVDVVEETEHAHSVTFAVPDDARDAFAFRPGQFLTLAVPSERTGLVARCYSLCSSPGDESGTLTITVKRTADGYASNWICDRVREGDTVRVLPPSGIFTPASLDADLLLLAGGSGITPIMSIVRTALARGSGRIVLLYANDDQRSVIFARDLAELAVAHPDRLHVVHWLVSVQGLPTQEQLRAFAAERSSWDAFVCGPPPFMRLTVAALKELGFPRERRHQEKFVSLGGNPFGDVPEAAAAEREIAEADRPDALRDASSLGSSGTVDGGPEPAVVGPVRLEVELDGETHAFDDWDPSTRLLDHLEAKGVKAPYSCRQGECSACAVRLLEGEVAMAANDVLDDEDLADGIRLACQSTPTTDVVRATYS